MRILIAYALVTEQQGYGNGPPPGEAGEGERGLLGAMGGAALGGFGGRKFGEGSGHGLLGTLGGIIAGGIAGSKLEDFGKE